MHPRTPALYWTLAYAACLIVIFGLGQAEAQDSVSGEAYGVSVNAAGTTVPKTPDAVLPPGGGMTQAEAAGISVPNLVGTDALSALSTGAIGGAVSLSTVKNVNLLDGLITAKLVVPISSSSADGGSAESDAAGSALVDLVVNGVPVEVTAPNTTIDIPGVGTVILNEQVPSGDGTSSSGLVVNMIHVVLKDPLTGTKTGDIVVGSAASGVSLSPFVGAHVLPPGACLFYTGGGRLDPTVPLSRQDFGTFGFNATTRNSPGGCGPAGQVEYHDHHYDIDIHGTSADIDSFDDFCAHFTGSARVRQGNTDLGTFTYRALACDFGEPGNAPKGTDTFEINIDGVYCSNASCAPGINGLKNPVLTGGNIQRHVH